MLTLYWHDYETWGEVPSRDRPSQFAGVRTDENLNIVGKPLMMYCQPVVDCLPKPMACMVTGLTPQRAQQEGIPEPEFIKRVHAELSRPGTCGVGYNSIRFDDEVTRYTLYRNFYDPYEREWRNGNSRWDIIDMVRLTYALRPQGIEWPLNDNGDPSFKLELLSAANGLLHDSAHDALSDVYATIELAKLIRNKHPNLYDYAFRMRAKSEVAKLIDLQERKPLLHVSSRFPASQGCAALVAPVAMHPVNKNAVIVTILGESPQLLQELSVEEIRSRLYTKTEDLEEGELRIPLKLVHLNKSPILLTPKMLDAEVERRLQIDKATCEKHWQQLLKMDIEKKLQKVFAENNFADSSDPEQSLYQGFIDDRDKSTFADIRSAGEKDFKNRTFTFYDQRLPELLLRYKARHYPSSLNEAEEAQWLESVQHRLRDEEGGRNFTLQEFRRQISELQADESLDEKKREVLRELQSYGDALEAKWGLTGSV